MAGLSIAHRAALAQLIARCPPELVEGLRKAVASWPGEKATQLGAMLGDASTDGARMRRVLGPILPMFLQREDGIEALVFPAGVLPNLWRATQLSEPDLLVELDREGEMAIQVASRLCRAAAAAVRDRPAEIWPEHLAPEGRNEGLEKLAQCLDLMPLAHKTMDHLEKWLGRTDGASQAELRLIIRDAGSVHEDGAIRLIDLLFAHMKDAALILRLVTQTSGAAGRDDFLSGSELGVFVDRLIKGVVDRSDQIAAFKPDPDTPGNTEACRAAIAWCAETLNELDVTLDLHPDSAWGKSVRSARSKVAQRLTDAIRGTSKAVEEALPMTRQALAGRMTRQVPKLSIDPGSRKLAIAEVQVQILGGVRSAAAVFGCESDRRKQADNLVDMLSRYADEAFDLIRGGEVEDEDRALELMEVVARFLGHLEAAEPARTVRRRVAATIHDSGMADENDAGASPEAA